MQHFGTLRQPLSWRKVMEERGYIPGRVLLYSRKSVFIFPEKRCYIPGRAWLYCRKSAVICLNETSDLPRLLLWSYALCTRLLEVSSLKGLDI